MLKFRSGNFIEEFDTIDENQQRNFGECIPFTLQQTRRYTNGFLNVETQLSTPFLDTQSEKSKQSNTNKIYILKHLDAKDLLKQLGRKRRDVKRLKDEDRQRNRKEIGKLQRDMLDLERQLFQHFMGILHCLTEEYYLQMINKSEEMQELREVCEHLQRNADLEKLKDPSNRSLNRRSGEKRSDSDTSPILKPSTNYDAKTIKELQNDIEELYDDLSDKERCLNRIYNLFQQLFILLPKIPNEAFPKTILGNNKSLIDDAASIPVQNEFELEEFVASILELADYTFYSFDKPMTPTPPVKDPSRRSSSSLSSDVPYNKNPIDAFFSTSKPPHNQEEALEPLRLKIKELEQQLANKAGSFRLEEQVNLLTRENEQLCNQVDALKSNDLLVEQRINAIVKQHQEELNNIQSKLNAELNDKQRIIDQLNQQLDALEQQENTTHINAMSTLRLEHQTQATTLRCKLFGHLLLERLYETREQGALQRVADLEKRLQHQQQQQQQQQQQLALADKREQRLNKDLDGVMLEFTRITLQVREKEAQCVLMQQQLKDALKESGDLKIKYDDMRMGMMMLEENDSMEDNMMLKSMMDGLRDGYMAEIEDKFKQINDMQHKIEALELSINENLYHKIGKSTQTE